MGWTEYKIECKTAESAGIFIATTILCIRWIVIPE